MKFQYKYICFSLLILALALSVHFAQADTTSILRPTADGTNDSADWSNTLGGAVCSAADCYTDVSESSGAECSSSSDGDLSYVASNI